jgi:hypothetical protein
MSEQRLITATSPAEASTVVGAIAARLDQFESIRVEATLLGAIGGVLDVYLQSCSDKDGTVWTDYAHYPQISAAAAAATYVFTAARSGQQLTMTAAGTGAALTATPSLAANTVIGGEFGDRLRVVFVAGVGTSAGALQTIRVVGTLGRV